MRILPPQRGRCQRTAESSAEICFEGCDIFNTIANEVCDTVDVSHINNINNRLPHFVHIVPLMLVQGNGFNRRRENLSHSDFRLNARATVLIQNSVILNVNKPTKSLSIPHDLSPPILLCFAAIAFTALKISSSSSSSSSPPSSSPRLLFSSP